ncbi:hypothetical protein D5E69_23300 (plasmid) [Rossellomorea marisflavi]|uniref:hypothetical protein n=1 Tax=Rossellomorea marisflavi TaxID=189381 RepID=UPI0013172FE6|nr:hypothetical protein [Rossellomorea marisflavi]QHA38760.1 hypothetical protein D5E69_23300 [Rossellomorea marisflavi]
MLRDVLWAIEAKMSYDRGKQTGLWGVLGIILVILGAWKWDSIIYPVLDFLGLVTIADRLGLISEYGGVTALRILAAFFILYLFVLITMAVIGLPIMFVSFLLGRTISIKSIVQGTALILLLIPLLPFFILLGVFKPHYFKQNDKITSAKKETKLDRKKRKEYSINQVEKYLIHSSEEIDVEDASKRLNRLFMKEDNNYPLAIHKNHSKNEEDQMYILLPSPLYAKGEYYERNTNQISKGIYLDKCSSESNRRFACIKINFVERGCNKLKLDTEDTDIQVAFLPDSYFNKIVLKTDENIRELFNELNKNKKFQLFTKCFNTEYIYKREINRLGMRYAPKEMFNEFKEELILLNARNADLFELMYGLEDLTADVISFKNIGYAKRNELNGTQF